MSLPPPPPPSDQPSFGSPQPGAPPPGYSPYGQWAQPGPNGQAGRPGKSAMAIAGLVLSLVGIVPCFWFWFLQIPGYLGVIFSAIGLRATNHGARSGRGLAVAGLVVGLVVVTIAALMTVYIYTSDDCVTDGLTFECNF